MKYRIFISIVDISANLENIDIDKAILENIDIDIDIDKAVLEYIDIDIDIDKDILENIDIDINNEISENIDIDKILTRLEFGISNRANVQSLLKSWINTVECLPMVTILNQNSE